MSSRVIPFPKRNKSQKLSTKMVIALVEAIALQQQGIPFGPADIRGGSIGPLISRGIVVHGNITVDKNMQSSWHVTAEGYAILRSMGVTMN